MRLKIKVSLKTLLLTFFIISSLGSNLKAQSLERKLISNAGTQFENEDVKVEWSLGEVAVSYFIKPTLILNQGFHQGNTLISFIDSQESWSDDIILYPNPAKDKIHFSKQLNIQLDYKIMDFSARVIRSDTWQGLERELDIRYLKEGIYVLLFSDSKNNQQAYKFIKL